MGGEHGGPAARVTHVGAPNQGHYVRDIYTTAVDIRLDGMVGDFL